MFEQDESMLRFGVTPVENLFIQEYLPAARGDYVKVYLYALYTSAHPKRSSASLKSRRSWACRKAMWRARCATGSGGICWYG